MSTLFTYQTVDYELTSCPEYPFSQSYVASTVASGFQDGSIATRPRVSNDISIYTLIFNAVLLADKLKMQELEKLVRGSAIFQWTPDFVVDNIDSSTIQVRDVRLASPVHYQMESGNVYSFTVNLQEAI